MIPGRSTSLEYCKGLAKRSRSNFYYSFLFLPKEQREAIYSVYAFCRAVDDVADQEPDRHRSAERLGDWREEVGRIFNGGPRHPISIKLSECVRRFSIPREYLDALIDGVEMDLHKTRYRTFEELYTYCYHVASVVGLMCIEVFGYQTPQAKVYAEKLGVALQLTNILRDLKTDAERGRIYLPLEDLDRFGYSEQELLRGQYDDRFISLMAFESQRAQGYYRMASAAIAPEDRPNLIAAQIMGAIYHALLGRIEGLHYDVFNRPVALPRYRKFYIALRVWKDYRLSPGPRRPLGKGPLRRVER
jgi:phytoene synthase